LKRAFDTAQAVYDHQKDPKPSFESSELVRELNFGNAAGHPMAVHADRSRTFQEWAAVGVYPAWYSDDDRFPGGESIKDLGERSKLALEKLVLPHVW
jgi:broad specificity phosphatase PhoE